MGSIVTCSIRTDGFRALEENPEELVSAIREGMNNLPGASRQSGAGGSVVTHHAHHYSESKVYVVADGKSIAFDEHSLRQLMENHPQYWSEESGIRFLLEQAENLSRRLIEVEQFLRARQSQMAADERETDS